MVKEKGFDINREKPNNMDIEAKEVVNTVRIVIEDMYEDQLNWFRDNVAQDGLDLHPS